MANNANKTRNDVSSTYQTNRVQGVDKERELEILSSQTEQFVGTHCAMVTNGTADMDNHIQEVHVRVSSNVNQVVDVICRQHEAIRLAFQEEANVSARIKQDSSQDQQNLDTTTRPTVQAVNAVLQRLNNILPD